LIKTVVISLSLLIVCLLTACSSNPQPSPPVDPEPGISQQTPTPDPEPEPEPDPDPEPEPELAPEPEPEPAPAPAPLSDQEQMLQDYNRSMQDKDTSLMIPDFYESGTRFYYDLKDNIEVSFIRKNGGIAYAIVEQSNRTSIIQNRNVAMIWGTLIDIFSPQNSYEEVMDGFKMNYDVSTHSSTYESNGDKYNNMFLGTTEVFMITDQSLAD